LFELIVKDTTHTAPVTLAFSEADAFFPDLPACDLYANAASARQLRRKM
jgi:hypothetical protein